MSASVEQIERPLMTLDEVMRLKPSKKSGSGPSERITAPGDMLIFVSGHHPIHGTQIPIDSSLLSGAKYASYRFSRWYWPEKMGNSALGSSRRSKVPARHSIRQSRSLWIRCACAALSHWGRMD